MKKLKKLLVKLFELLTELATYGKQIKQGRSYGR